MNDILQIIESATGNHYKKMASTHGGEYKGPCPWCGGDDRFSIHPSNEHYVCRRCGAAGDSITFTMKFHNMPYLKACIELGREPKFNNSTSIYNRIIKEDTWTPRETCHPCLTWQAKAEAVAFNAFKFLMSLNGKTHREFLSARGISIQSIKKARLGYNQSAVSFDRASWGLDSEQLKTGGTGGQKSIWIPEGFIIPFFQNDKIVRIRVRQADPNANQRYILVAGSSTEYMSFPGDKSIAPADTAFLVEAELDAILCNQEFGESTTIYAIGNTTARPDMTTHEELTKKKKIILCLDNDDAGIHETTWWKNQYGQNIVVSQPVPIEFGKDPGEAFQNGFDLKTIANRVAIHQSKSIALKPAKKRTETANIEKQEPAVDLSSNIVDPVKTIQQSILQIVNKICLHGHQCVSAKDGICLAKHQHFSDLEKCPRDQWYFYDKGNIRQVIYGCSFKTKPEAK